MSQGQVAGGYDDDDSRSTGWLLIIGVAVVAALLSLVTHHTSSDASPQPPAPSAFAQPTPSASASASALPSDQPSAQPSASSAPPSAADPTQEILSQIGGYVSVGEVCTPVTDGRTELTVQFLLRNATGLTERLISVTPELPMGGLVPRGTFVQTGDCAHPTGKAKPPARNAMSRAGTLVVSLKFGLPKSCPAPYPVQAVVKVDIAGKSRLDTVALYTDLGTVPFDLCKKA